MSALGRMLATQLVQLMLGTGVFADSAYGGEAHVECAIRSTAISGGVVLQAVVVASSTIEGSYSLSVSGTGSGGSADISQGGRFTAAPGVASRLGSMTVGRGSYTAHLEIAWSGGHTSCSRASGG